MRRIGASQACPNLILTVVSFFFFIKVFQPGFFNLRDLFRTEPITERIEEFGLMVSNVGQAKSQLLIEPSKRFPGAVITEYALLLEMTFELIGYFPNIGIPKNFLKARGFLECGSVVFQSICKISRKRIEGVQADS